MALAFRKNQASLSGPEKQQFVQAVLNLKAEKKGNTNTYDQYVQWHKDTVRTNPPEDDAHNGPAFFAWHREYLRRFERDLQRVGWGLGLPYWNWSIDNSKTSSIWGTDFMGPNGDPSQDNQVMAGPFAYSARPQGDPRKWALNVRTDEEPNVYLRRQFQVVVDSLPTRNDVQRALEAKPFDVDPWDANSQSGFRNRAEGWLPDPPGDGMHVRVHRWVGGSMRPMTSPNDPVFFLHHCFMDKLWADWQVFQLQLGDNALYLPTHGARTGHNLDDRMRPWNDERPADLLYHHGQLGYRYDTDCDMQPFEELRPGEQISSVGGGYALNIENGNLVLHTTPPGATLWDSGTAGRQVGFCRMEGYGNLVLYSPDGKQIVWQSHTDGNAAGSRLVVRQNGKVAIYQPNGVEIWSRPPPRTG